MVDEGEKTRTIAPTCSWVAGCTTHADCWTFTVEKWRIASVYSEEPSTIGLFSLHNMIMEKITHPNRKPKTLGVLPPMPHRLR